MNYNVKLLQEAIDDLSSIDRVIVTRIFKKLDWLKENFDLITPESLKGELKGLYKLRIGDYRILYTFSKDKKLISIHLIGHRKEIYRK